MYLTNNKYKYEINYLNLELNKNVRKLSDLIKSVGITHADIIYISTISDIILYEGNSVYLKKFYKVLSNILIKYLNLPNYLFEEPNHISTILINIVDIIDDLVIIKNKLGEKIIYIPIFIA